jgi:hypothetical protein
MSPGGHLVTTAAACAAVWAGTGSAALTAGLAVGGFLIDVDHAVDYVVFERQRDLRPRAFLLHYSRNEATRAVLLLHSWELVPVLAAAAWITGSMLLWGYLLGMGLHLALDVVFNGRLATHSLVPFYSFIRRAAAGFRFARLVHFRELEPLPAGFWRTFFIGPTPRREPRRPQRTPANIAP